MTTTTTTAPAGPASGFEHLASEIAADIASAKANAAAWIQQVEAKAQVAVGQLAKFQNNPIVQALENITLGPVLEADIARWLADIGQFLATAAPGTPLPAPPVVPPAPAPAPADPAAPPAPTMGDTGTGQ